MPHPQEATEAYRRGLAHADHRKNQKALAEFDRALQLDPEYAEAYCQRGLTHFILLVEDLYYALALKPNVKDADSARGVLKGFLGEDYWQAAKEGGGEIFVGEIKKASMPHPQEATEAYRRGLVHSNHEEYQKALAEFDRALQLDPEYAEAYCQRGLTHFFLLVIDLYYALALNPNVKDADEARALLRGYMGEDYWQITKESVGDLVGIYSEYVPPSLVSR